MLNSRHERAIVIVASYVIGFVSAYIAYGIPTTLPANPIVMQPPIENLAEVKPGVDASIHVDSFGLSVITDDRLRLLSARRASPMLANVGSAAEPGLAYKLTEAELSRDGKYVYFCEQIVEDADTCDPYVYSINEDVLHPVKVNGEEFKPENDTHVSAWSPSGFLTINDHMSYDISTPWLMR